MYIKKLQTIQDDIGWHNPESKTDQFVIKKIMELIDILIEDKKQSEQVINLIQAYMDSEKKCN